MIGISELRMDGRYRVYRAGVHPRFPNLAQNSAAKRAHSLAPDHGYPVVFRLPQPRTFDSWEAFEEAAGKRQLGATAPMLLIPDNDVWPVPITGTIDLMARQIEMDRLHEEGLDDAEERAATSDNGGLVPIGLLAICAVFAVLLASVTVYRVLL